eukprot:1656172-Pyramimonas_sp.AAC.1
MGWHVSAGRGCPVAPYLAVSCGRFLPAGPAEPAGGWRLTAVCASSRRFLGQGEVLDGSSGQ